MRQALRKAGVQEIGGQIFGEQLAPSDFRVLELTIQRQHGTIARFMVNLAHAASHALRFFDRTRHHYEKFNYIGEWHSHPSFAVAPSGTDRETMCTLVESPSFRGTFAVLLIVRLDDTEIAHGAWVFSRGGIELLVTVEMDDD